MALPEELASIIGNQGDAQGNVRVHEGRIEMKLGDGNWYALADVIEFIHRHMKAVDAQLHPAPTPPPEPPPPPNPTFELNIGASSLSIANSQGASLDGDHIGNWGHPGESVSVRVHADAPTMGTLTIDYVLAESSSSSSVRDVAFGTASQRVTFEHTTDVWATPVHGQEELLVTLPAGDTTIRVAIPGTVPDWSNWLDLYKLTLKTDKKVTTLGVSPEPQPEPEPVPPTTPPPPPTNPPPVTGTYDFVVGRDGTLQQLLDRGDGLQRPITIGVPSGVWAGANILNKQYKMLTLFLEDGAVIRGASGITGYGGIENLRITCNPRKAFIEADGHEIFGEGIFIDSTRNDMGGNGQPAGNIIVENVVVRPIAGTGIIQRNGIAIWGADRVQVLGCEVHHAGGNAFAGYGSAGSLISIGHGIRNPRVSGAYACRIAGNYLHDAEISDGQVSADRNGIIMDLYQGGFQPYSNRVVGPVLIEDNDVRNVAGRGIELLACGLPDSIMTIRRNKVSGRYAYGLGTDPNQGNPKCAIGGYGAGQFSSVICSDNEVDTSQGAGKPAYQFDNFDGGDGSGVKGSGNKGGPAIFNASPTNSVPAGFLQ